MAWREPLCIVPFMSSLLAIFIFSFCYLPIYNLWSPFVAYKFPTLNCFNMLIECFDSKKKFFFSILFSVHSDTAGCVSFCADFYSSYFYFSSPPKVSEMKQKKNFIVSPFKAHTLKSFSVFSVCLMLRFSMHKRKVYVASSNLLIDNHVDVKRTPACLSFLGANERIINTHTKSIITTVNSHIFHSSSSVANHVRRLSFTVRFFVVHMGIFT